MTKRGKLTALTNHALQRVSGGISVPALDAIDQIVERLNVNFLKRRGSSLERANPSRR